MKVASLCEESPLETVSVILNKQSNTYPVRQFNPFTAKSKGCLETSDPETSDLETSDLETSDLETSDLETSDLETSDLETSDLAVT